ncbi:conjugal transfer protein TrbJ [Cupriavidus pauculus]
MKLKTRIAGFITAAICASSALAGSVAGTGGSTELTQIANNLQLIQQYEQTVSGYVRQGLQYEAQLKNLIQNPASILPTDLQQMITGVSKIMSGGQSIGYNLQQIDANFASTFRSPQAKNFADRFKLWNATGTDTFNAVLNTVGLQRDQYSSSQAALTDLYNRSQATNGNLDALQTLAQINVRQIQQMQSLQELMAAQSQAETTYMQAQTSRQAESAAVAEGAQVLLQGVPTNYQPTKSAPMPRWSTLLNNK